MDPQGYIYGRLWRSGFFHGPPWRCVDGCLCISVDILLYPWIWLDWSWTMVIDRYPARIQGYSKIIHGCHFRSHCFRFGAPSPFLLPSCSVLRASFESTLYSLLVLQNCLRYRWCPKRRASDIDPRSFHLCLHMPIFSFYDFLCRLDGAHSIYALFTPSRCPFFGCKQHLPKIQFVSPFRNHT